MKNLSEQPKQSTTKRIIARVRRISPKQITLISSALVIMIVVSLTTFQVLKTNRRETNKNKVPQISLDDKKQVKIEKPLPKNDEPAAPESPTAEPTANKTQPKSETPQPKAENPKPPNTNGGTTPSQPPQPPQPPSGSAEAQQILALVNQARTAAGLTPLTLNATLTEAANIRAREIVSVQSHTRPNGEPWYTVSPLARGENIAAGHTSAQQVFDAWMNSEGHRANILRPEYRTLGVGYVYQSGGSPAYVHYWVQLFGV